MTREDDAAPVEAVPWRSWLPAVVLVAGLVACLFFGVQQWRAGNAADRGVCSESVGQPCLTESREIVESAGSRGNGRRFWRAGDAGRFTTHRSDDIADVLVDGSSVTVWSHDGVVVRVSAGGEEFVPATGGDRGVLVAGLVATGLLLLLGAQVFGGNGGSVRSQRVTFQVAGAILALMLGGLLTLLDASIPAVLWVTAAAAVFCVAVASLLHPGDTTAKIDRLR